MTQEDKKPSRSFVHAIQEIFANPSDTDSIVHFLKKAQDKNLIGNNALSMIEGVMHISDMRVQDVMIPRAQMIFLDKDADFDEVMPTVVSSAHSRFPIMSENREEVVGILLAKDLLKWVHESSQEERFSLRPWMRAPTFVPENKRLDALLNDFRQNRNHLAIVVDEYGAVTGLVTIEDVLEQIVGDIVDEHDDNDDESTILSHDDGHWTIKAITPIEEFDDMFSTDFQSQGVDTVGGLVLKAFGRLPSRAEKVHIEGFAFTIVRADNRRIYLLNVEKSSNDSSSPSS
ncbi:MAG: magnesium/cobalt efflux protein [Legionellales bacterium]|nr:magnesium/cobalt efflux protein [Legionellales bacterium]|tara:strand:+ start:45 stop:905 length:861 start_codon:yes stop_codon:yes gene_type:complete